MLASTLRAVPFEILKGEGGDWKTYHSSHIFIFCCPPTPPIPPISDTITATLGTSLSYLCRTPLTGQYYFHLQTLIFTGWTQPCFEDGPPTSLHTIHAKLFQVVLVIRVQYFPLMLIKCCQLLSATYVHCLTHCLHSAEIIRIYDNTDLHISQ